MKGILLILLAVGSLNASAFGGIPTDFPSDMPNEAGWSLFMISQACGIQLQSLSILKGSLHEGADGGVVYDAHTASGELVFRAIASNSTMFADKQCVVEP